MKKQEIQEAAERYAAEQIETADLGDYDLQSLRSDATELIVYGANFYATSIQKDIEAARETLTDEIEKLTRKRDRSDFVKVKKAFQDRIDPLQSALETLNKLIQK